MMKTFQNIMAMLTGPTLLDDLAAFLRSHDQDFVQKETQYKASVLQLRESLDAAAAPRLDEYLCAWQTEVTADLLYASYLGYRMNLDNFHAPCTLNFVQMDFTNYIREHLLGHFPMCYCASRTKEAFHLALPEKLYDAEMTITDYYIALDVTGPKLAHYAGYIFANQFLPWVEPGYQVDRSQTLLYENELRRYFNYLPL